MLVEMNGREEGGEGGNLALVASESLKFFHCSDIKQFD